MEVRPITRVVVPLDGSSLAEGAIPYACTLTRNHLAEIVFLTVLPDESYWPNQETRQTLYRAEKTAQYVAAVRSEIRFGEPSTEIVNFSVEESADIVAMTTHGHTGDARKLRGSVTEEVMTITPIPVSAVKAAEWMGNLDVTRPIDHLILPIDGSWRSVTVEEMATRLAVTLGAKVTIYHVKEGANTPDIGVFKELHAVLTQHGVDVDFTVHKGDPQVKLRNYASTFPTSIVVMCSRGPGDIADRPRGSVMDYVLRHGRAPVVMVPATRGEPTLETVYSKHVA